VKKKRRKKPNRATWLIVLLVCGYFLYNFVSTEIQLIQLRSQRDYLQEQISIEKDKSDQLTQELEQIHSDEYIETLARRYFGLVYPREKIIIEVEPDSNKN